MAEAAEAAPPARRLALGRTAAIPAAVLALDQLAKTWVRASLTLNEPVELLGENVRLLYIHNAGAAFGLSVGTHSSTVFLALAVLASVLVGWLFLTAPSGAGLQRAALGLILGGALGNIVDRLRFDQVVDFIQVGVGGHYWPIFNVADSAVTIGAILLALTYLRGGARSP